MPGPLARLAAIPVSMTPRKAPAVIGSSDDCRSALRQMDASGTRRLAVVDEERLVGLVTEDDIHRLVAEAIADPEEDSFLRFVNVGGAMRYRPATIPSSASLRDAARTMVERGVDQLLVVENGRPQGVLTALEALRFFLEAIRSDAAANLKVPSTTKGITP